jgi:ribonuclease H2 subunit A
MEHWQFSEPLGALGATATGSAITRDFGSGYPSDPKCKDWMKKNLQDPVFGWPDVVRFSWGPAKKMLLDQDNRNVALVTFEADDEEDDLEMMDQAAIAGRKRQQAQMSAFLKKGKTDQRYPYFERTNLQEVTNIF